MKLLGKNILLKNIANILFISDRNLSNRKINFFVFGIKIEGKRSSVVYGNPHMHSTAILRISTSCLCKKVSYWEIKTQYFTFQFPKYIWPINMFACVQVQCLKWIHLPVPTGGLDQMLWRSGSTILNHKILNAVGMLSHRLDQMRYGCGIADLTKCNQDAEL